MNALLLLAGPALALVPDPHATTGSEPVRIQRTHVQQQARLRHGEVWQEFLASDGAGWLCRFDERTGLPFRAWGPGIDLGPVSSPAEAEAAVRRFVAGHAWLLGVTNDQLELSAAAHVAADDTWYVDLDQVVHGVPVYRSGLKARIRGDRLVMFGLTVSPGAAATSTRPELTAERARSIAVAGGPAPGARHRRQGAGLVILPREVPGGLENRLAWEIRSSTDQPPGSWVSHVDAISGELLDATNEIPFLEGQVFGQHDTRTVDGSTSISAIPNAPVDGASSSTWTAADGSFSMPDDDEGPFTTSLQGEYVRVKNAAGPEAAATIDGSTFTWIEGDAATQAEIDSYVFLHQVRDWGLEYAPELGSRFYDSLRSNVNLNSTCNAYYDGAVNFYKAGGGCNNTGRIADVNYHEWGHGFHAYSMVSGVYDGTASEGIADIVSFLMTGDHVIAPYFFTSGAGIRDVAEDRVYPDDWTYESHADSLIFSGAVWDLWEELQAELPADQAYDTTVSLFATAIKSGPTIPETYDEFVLADDDDGDLGNGTPHLCEIVDAFARHGLGPGGSAGVLQLAHEPLGNQPAGVEIPVEASLDDLAPGCDDSTVNDGAVHFSVDDGESWQQVPLNATGDSSLAGAIPAQPDGTIVLYYLEVETSDGQVLYNPAGATINPHSFYAGGLEQLYCEDFEDPTGGDYIHELVSGTEELGADDWQLGTPAGAGGDPDYAWSGDAVWANDLGIGRFNGEYQDSKYNRLSSPPIDLGGHDGDLVIQFRRWLTVEDGIYDHARVLADGVELWSNHASSLDAGTEHHIDRQWALHTLRARDVDGDGRLSLSWELESDEGLTMGGWNIDDVCIYAPAAAPPPGDTGDTGAAGARDTPATGPGGAPSLMVKGACGGCATPGSGTPPFAIVASILGLVALRRRS